MTIPTSNTPSDAAHVRSVRVFVSSTFRDMVEDRDELVLRVFPRLRKEFAKRGVVWSEVDLRWGITDEEVAEGRVLPLCLEEIARCRPYFIALLGERYGYIPDSMPNWLRDTHPWLDDYRDRSITELEIIHGVLRRPEMAGRSFFYFRDPEYALGQPETRRSNFIETLSENRVREIGRPAAERELEKRRRLLSGLKQEIRDADRAGLCHLHQGSYADPKELGQWVFDDFTELMRERFAPAAAVDWFEASEITQRGFERTLVPIVTDYGERWGVYFPREDCFEKLDEFARGTCETPLVVTGPPGTGKSALLANWLETLKDCEQPCRFIRHFVQAGGESASWDSMLRRLIRLLDAPNSGAPEISLSTDALKLAFADSLHRAASTGPIIILIDGVDYLEDRDGALELAWLPTHLPPMARLILSSSPGRSFTEIERRGWDPTISLVPFDKSLREEFSIPYLRHFGKSLPAECLRKVCEADQCSNPRHLKVLLDELRVFGSHEELEQHLDRYLDERTVAGLLRAILTRYQDDYDRDRANLVRDTMSYLCCARNGLEEEELRELLGSRGQPIPHATLAPLLLAAESFLVEKAGVIDFAHTEFGSTVAQEFMRKPTFVARTHASTAGYFSTLRDEGDLGPRVLDELPWQLKASARLSGSWKHLSELLSDIGFMHAGWQRNEYDVRHYWTELESGAGVTPDTAYAEALRSPASIENPHAAVTLALVCDNCGQLMSAEPVWRHLASDASSVPATVQARALTNLGTVRRAEGRLSAALRYYREAEALYRAAGELDELHRSIGNQGLVLQDMGRLQEALQCHAREQAVCRDSANLDRLAIALGSQITILTRLNRLDEAHTVLAGLEETCRMSGSPLAHLRLLAHRSLLAGREGDRKEAEALTLERLLLARTLGCWRHQHESLANLAMIRLSEGDPHAALRLLDEEDEITRRAGDTIARVECLHRKAAVLMEIEAWDKAESALRQMQECASHLERRDWYARATAALANLLESMGRHDEALRLAVRARLIAREDDLRNVLLSLHEILPPESSDEGEDGDDTVH